MNQIKERVIKYIYVPIFIAIFPILAATIIIVSDVKVENLKIREIICEIDVKKYFIPLLDFERYSQKTNARVTISSFVSLSLFVVTNISPTDPKTFLGTEIPGLNLYGERIGIAGKGTNLNTLPLEESPSMKDLMEEEKQTREKENHKTTKNNERMNSPLRKKVLVYQTHSWEAFLPSLKDATDPNNARSSDERVNIIAVGERLSNSLRKRGIGVEHDQTNIYKLLNEKKWSTSKSYDVSRGIVKEVMKNNSDLQYLIDLHRDSQRKEITTALIHGRKYARLYFIVGKENKNYIENYLLAKHLHEQLEAKYPGISRGVLPKTKVDSNGLYNQDISSKAVLVEMGGVDNTSDEMNRTIEAFSEQLVNYIKNEEK